MNGYLYIYIYICDRKTILKICSFQHCQGITPHLQFSLMCAMTCGQKWWDGSSPIGRCSSESVGHKLSHIC